MSILKLGLLKSCQWLTMFGINSLDWTASRTDVRKQTAKRIMSSRIIFLLAVVLALQVHVNLSVVKCPKLPECPEQEKKGCFEDDDCPASTNNYDYKCCPTPSKLGCNVKRVCKAIRRPEFRDVKCPKLPECPDQEEKRCFEDDDCPAPTNNYDYKCCPTPSNLGCHVGRVCTGIRR